MLQVAIDLFFFFIVENKQKIDPRTKIMIILKSIPYRLCRRQTFSYFCHVVRHYYYSYSGNSLFHIFAGKVYNGRITFFSSPWRSFVDLNESRRTCVGTLRDEIREEKESPPSNRRGLLGFFSFLPVEMFNIFQAFYFYTAISSQYPVDLKRGWFVCCFGGVPGFDRVTSWLRCNYCSATYLGTNWFQGVVPSILEKSTIHRTYSYEFCPLAKI